MKKSFLFSLLLIIMIGIPCMSEENSAMKNWPQFRGDRALTGHSDLKGHIETPEIKWNHFIGARETLLKVKFGGGSARRSLPSMDMRAEVYETMFIDWKIGRPINADDYGGSRWVIGMGTPMMDLDGNGELTPVPNDPLYKVGKFLPDVPGLQKVESETTFTKSRDASSHPTAAVKLFVRNHRDWKQLWKSEEIPMLYNPEPIVGDFDGDGKKEIAVLAWYDLWVLDLETGKTKYKCRFIPDGSESGRAYGRFEAVDINHDGKMEFVILSDFESQMDVLGFVNGELKVLWNRLLEHGVAMKKQIFRPGAFPVCDVDGDGIAEIAVSMFNNQGDDKWHVQVYDAMTGKMKYDLPNQIVSGVCDLTGEGIADLLCTQMSGRIEPTESNLSIVNFKDGKQNILWQRDGCSFQTQHYADFPVSLNCVSDVFFAALAGPVDVGEKPIFITRKMIDESSRTVELAAWQSGKDGKINKLGSVTGPNLEGITLSHSLMNSGLLVRACSTGRANTIVTDGAVAKTLLSRASGAPIAPAVAGVLSSGGKMSVIAQDPCEQLVCFNVSPNGNTSTKWRVSARGICTGILEHTGGTMYGGAVLADVLGNGTLATIGAKSSPDGCARLVAYDPQGNEIWHSDFAGFSGISPEHSYFYGGLALWFAGHFTDRNHEDLIVTLRRSTSHTEESFLINGRTGEKLWHRTVGSRSSINADRACGGTWMAITDLDGDGLDDAVCCFPDGILYIKGSNGDILKDVSTRYTVFPSAWAMFAFPAVANLADGKRAILYCSPKQLTGVVSMDSKALWYVTDPTSTPGIYSGIGDIDGDGKLEVAGPGYGKEKGTTEHEFHCYDSVTGRLKWKLALPGRPDGFYTNSPVSPITCDIDSDGKDECIFGIGETLYAVSADRSGTLGEIKWKVDFPARVGPASIVEVGGKLRIIVSCEDGCVYGVGDLRN